MQDCVTPMGQIQLHQYFPKIFPEPDGYKDYAESLPFKFVHPHAYKHLLKTHLKTDIYKCSYCAQQLINKCSIHPPAKGGSEHMNS